MSYSERSPLLLEKCKRLGDSVSRQSSHVSAEKLAIDPQNRLLSRGPRFRLDAEVIRDQALAISGLMVDEIGGKSVRPYQPEGYWEHLNFPKRVYKHHDDARQHREERRLD